MSYFDDVYCGLCKDILENGVQVHNRTGIDTIKVPSAHFHLDLSKEFPILTTKQLFIRQAVTEMLWIYQAQSNDVRWLQERNVHIWDKWEINEDGDWIDENTGKVLKHFDPSFAHTIGTAYGFIVKKYDLMNKLTEHGVSIIMVSSELPEVLGMSDRIMVIHEGTVAGILESQGATQESVITLATGGK